MYIVISSIYHSSFCCYIKVSQEVVVNIQVLWHMILCKLGNSYSHSVGACLHIQGSPMVSSCTTLYMEVGNSSQISVTISQLKQLHVLGDLSLHLHVISQHLSHCPFC